MDTGLVSFSRRASAAGNDAGGTMRSFFQMLPTEWCPWSILIPHVRYQVQLGPQVDRESMGHLAKQTTVCSLGDFLDHKIYLMCGAPHTQDIIGRLLLEKCHVTTNVAGHGVLPVRGVVFPVINWSCENILLSNDCLGRIFRCQVVSDQPTLPQPYLLEVALNPN
jgi:hypothetical protein